MVLLRVLGRRGQAFRMTATEKAVAVQQTARCSFGAESMSSGVNQLL